MKKIVLYTKRSCPYCSDAKSLLQKKGQDFEEIDIAHNPDQRPIMIERAGGRSTVPQIFIGDYHVGGRDDLYALKRSGKLDALLSDDE